MFYFSTESAEDDFCYNLDYWKEYMADNQLIQIELYKAVRSVGIGFFFCREYMGVFESGQSCGKLCDKYSPNNGKNGICRHYGYCYEPSDEKLLLLLTAEKKYTLLPVTS